MWFPFLVEAYGKERGVEPIETLTASASRHLLFFGFFWFLRAKWTRLVKNEKKFPRENAAAMFALKK